jgi:hypothetical protein
VRKFSSLNVYWNPELPRFSVLSTVALLTLARQGAANDQDVPSPDEMEPVVEDSSEVLVTSSAEASLATAFPPPPAGSGGIALFPVVATNLTEGESAALGVLLASHLREQKGGRIIAPEIAGKYSLDSSDQQAAASYMKVEQYLSVEAVRLDRTTIVTATLYDQGGRVVWSAKMSGKSVDDFQYISERLVNSLLTGTPLEKTRTLDNVTANEAEGTNRTFVEKVFGFKTGVVVPYSAQIKLASMVGLSFDARLEGRRYFLEFGGGLLVPAASYDGGAGEAYGGLFADLGASYYLTQTDISPYVGAGAMPRILSMQPASLAVYSQAGLMFFRTSSSRLYTELRVAQNLTPMEIVDYTYNSAGDEGISRTRFWPIEFGLNVGLGW